MARILIVEDDRDTSQLLARRLENYGHETVVAPSARMAVKHGRHRFSGGRGHLGRRLTRHERIRSAGRTRRHPELDNPDLPAIFLSGHTDRESIARGQAMGASYLLKPFVSSELQGAIIKALSVRN